KGDEWIIIPYIKIRDFQWIEVVQTMTEGVLGVQYSIKDVLFSAGELLPGTPFIVVYTDRSSIPFRAISFIDENNERRQFLVFENLRSPEDRLGSFVFYEYKMNSNNTEINDNLCGEQEEE
ncbi:MAG: hypothetical protein LBC96_03940, partial [Lachnospiraceae bacterium]|nr:hypothetical protein [Lachnospiraceae bacterium]